MKENRYPTILKRHALALAVSAIVHAPLVSADYTVNGNLDLGAGTVVAPDNSIISIDNGGNTRSVESGSDTTITVTSGSSVETNVESISLLSEGGTITLEGNASVSNTLATYAEAAVLVEGQYQEETASIVLNSGSSVSIESDNEEFMVGAGVTSGGEALVSLDAASVDVTNDTGGIYAGYGIDFPETLGVAAQGVDTYSDAHVSAVVTLDNASSVVTEVATVNNYSEMDAIAVGSFSDSFGSGNDAEASVSISGNSVAEVTGTTDGERADMITVGVDTIVDTYNGDGAVAVTLDNSSVISRSYNTTDYGLAESVGIGADSDSIDGDVEVTVSLNGKAVSETHAVEATAIGGDEANATGIYVDGSTEYGSALATINLADTSVSVRASSTGSSWAHGVNVAVEGNASSRTQITVTGSEIDVEAANLVTGIDAEVEDEVSADQTITLANSSVDVRLVGDGSSGYGWVEAFGIESEVRQDDTASGSANNTIVLNDSEVNVTGGDAGDQILTGVFSKTEVLDISGNTSITLNNSDITVSAAESAFSSGIAAYSDVDGNGAIDTTIDLNDSRVSVSTSSSGDIVGVGAFSDDDNDGNSSITLDNSSVEVINSGSGYYTEAVGVESIQLGMYGVPNGEVSLINGSSVSVTADNGYALGVVADTVTVDATSRITASGNFDDAIEANTLTNAGTIEGGVEVEGLLTNSGTILGDTDADELVNTSTGVIETVNASTEEVDAETVTNSGIIRALIIAPVVTNNAGGLIEGDIFGGSDLVPGTALTITNNAGGQIVGDIDVVTLSNGGTITGNVLADDIANASGGLVVGDISAVTLNNNGIVRGSIVATNINLNSGSSVSLDSDSDSVFGVTSSSGVVGEVLLDAASVEVTTTDLDGVAVGIRATSVGSTVSLSNGSSVLVSGYFAQGIEADTVTIDATSSVIAEGSMFDDAIEANTLTNAGTIEGGVEVEGLLTNSGTIREDTDAGELVNTSTGVIETVNASTEEVDAETVTNSGIIRALIIADVVTNNAGGLIEGDIIGGSDNFPGIALEITNTAGGQIVGDINSDGLNNSGMITGNILADTMLNNAGGLVVGNINAVTVSNSGIVRGGIAATNLTVGASGTLEAVLTDATNPEDAHFTATNITLADNATIKVNGTSAAFNPTLDAVDYLIVEASGALAATEDNLNLVYSSLINVSWADSGANQLIVAVSAADFNEIAEDSGANPNAVAAAGAAISVLEDLGESPESVLFSEAIREINDTDNWDALASDVSGAASESIGQSVSTVAQQVGAQLGGSHGMSSGDTPVKRGLWVQGIYTDGEDDGVNAYDVDSTGFTIGYDRSVGNGDIVVGGAISYITTDIEAALNDEDVDSYLLSAYASYDMANWFASAIFSYGTGDHDTKRDTVTAGIAESDYDSDSLSARFQVGYKYVVNGWSIAPKVGFNYSVIDMDSRDETGSILAKATGSQRYETVELGLGLNLSKGFAFGEGQLTPELGIMAYHNYAQDSVQLTSRYVVGGDNFIETGEDVEADTYQASAGVTWDMSDMHQLKLIYTYSENDDFSADTVVARYNYSF